MKKVLKYILNVFILAWNGALVLFLIGIITAGFILIVNKVLANNLAGSCILAVALILATIAVGAKLDERMKK